MKAQQKKLSGCASNLLAHEDLGHFEEAHHWNIQAKFYNEKFPLSIWKWQHRRLSIMKIMVLLWSTSVEKKIVALSLFISFLGLFYLAFLFFYWDNALLNDDHHTSIYLQLKDYNSILEQSMTLYECLRRCTGMGNESRVTCMKNYAWWACHKYDVNYMIMQGNMTMMKRVIINETVESWMAIYLGMAMEMP